MAWSNNAVFALQGSAFAFVILANAVFCTHMGRIVLKDWVDMNERDLKGALDIRKLRKRT
ncbi:hypothetical protein RchiOBHm_Chr5g0006951 [Rosa chinensis]|uniref:Uncharacterized protein n=1 Tax=Rosa chinensis TaxID=74649 RepID=A0A2P6Q3P9_ROSCH|nr:hypothetical protein RchiOBHm_Chr5g0006951 [Rosa chinensis]